MLLRTVVGAVATVAVIGGLAIALPERAAVKTQQPAAGTTFGSVAHQFPPDAKNQVASGAGETTALLKLAAYAPARDGGVSTAPAAASTIAVSPAVPAQAAVQPEAALAVAIADAAGSPPADAAASAGGTSVHQADAGQPPAKPEPPRQVAALPPPQPATSNSSLVNINTASVADLDRLPGAGRIGVAIARRRPYRSIEDLVHKRVLRETAFQRIRSAITVN